TGNIHAMNVAFRESGRRYGNINLASALTLDPHRIELQGAKLDAFGGEFAGNVSLRDFEQFKVQGQLHHFSLDNLYRLMENKPLGYAGIVSGPIEAEGNLKKPGVTGIQANANLTITPGGKGIPVSGRL